MLQRYKARIVRLQTQRMHRPTLDTNSNDKMEGEEPTVFHFLKISRRRNMRDIRQVRDTSGHVATTHEDIANTFVAHFH